jgi:hypothetical protein
VADPHIAVSSSAPARETDSRGDNSAAAVYEIGCRPAEFLNLVSLPHDRPKGPASGCD